MKAEYIVIIICIILFILLSYLVIRIIRKRTKKNLTNNINNLEIRKNNLGSMPVMVELSKIEDIAKSEQLEEKVNEFKTRYKEIKEIKLTKINDMITELDMNIEYSNVKEFVDRYSDVEMELDEAEYSLNNIMHEIDEIASYEEKYRDIITKLKAKYRFLEHTYTEKETLFKDLQEVIKMQFENIAKRFSDFDKVMDEKLYNEVVLVVKSIDTMIDNLDIIIKELPDILLLLNDLIPGRIKDLKKEYNKMQEEGYLLNYLNFDANIGEIEKKESDILTRAKVLNIKDSLFDLRAILEYLDNLFKDLEEEKESKTKFDSLSEAFDNKEKRLSKIVKDIYDELDDIKSLYHLNEKDLEIIEELNLKLSVVTKDNKKLKRAIKKGDASYKKHILTMNELLSKINNLSQDFDQALRDLGSFYDDEMRAREELKNMKSILRKSKEKIRLYHLPIIYENYYIEEEEALDAIKEVTNELENKPVVIKRLNTRVDTARDLTFKFYANVNNMIEYAHFSEMLIVYGNKYRSQTEINKGLTKAELLYYKGNYKESFEMLLKVIDCVDNELLGKINKVLKDK